MICNDDDDLEYVWMDMIMMALAVMMEDDVFLFISNSEDADQRHRPVVESTNGSLEHPNGDPNGTNGPPTVL